MRKKKLKPPYGAYDANKFDKLLKKNFKPILGVCLRRIIGLDFDALEFLEIQKQQVTLEMEPDFICRVRQKGSGHYLIHIIEFESRDSLRTVLRYLMLVGILTFKFGLPVRIDCFYLGSSPPKYLNGVYKTPWIEFHFHVHQLRSMSYKEFLDSNVPEEVMLAILTNPEPLTKEELVRQIVERLQHLSKNDEEKLWERVVELTVFSMLRNLEPVVIKTVEEMSLFKDFGRRFIELKPVKELLTKSLEEGWEEGLEEGLKKGREEGLEKGRLLTQIQAIRRFYLKGMDAAFISDMLGMNPSEVAKYLEQVKHWDEIRALLNKPRASVKTIAKKLHVSPLVVEAVKLETNGKVNGTN
ncbi:MAG: hypothetical protein KatS3mg029_0134 [Saprospiraceae bacterium]|nr:MAG: hypothetical protein KatS3mg029_0134 [Saprospiraceae bacterium]